MKNKQRTALVEHFATTYGMRPLFEARGITVDFTQVTEESKHGREREFLYLTEAEELIDALKSYRNTRQLDFDWWQWGDQYTTGIHLIGDVDGDLFFCYNSITYSDGHAYEYGETVRVRLDKADVHTLIRLLKSFVATVRKNTAA